MTSIKQKIYEKIGVSEASIRNNKIFSPDSKQRPTQFSSGSKDTDGLSIKKASSSLNIDQFTNSFATNKSTNNPTSSKFEAHRLDILVPNATPPVPQIKAYKSIVSPEKPEKKPKKANTLNLSFNQLDKGTKVLTNTNRSTKFSSINASKTEEPHHLNSSLKTKKHSLMHMISDKEQKFGSKSFAINDKANRDSLLMKNNETTSVKREINLLNNRLNKLFGDK